MQTIQDDLILGFLRTFYRNKAKNITFTVTIYFTLPKRNAYSKFRH